MEYNFIIKHENPEILLITPLRKEDHVHDFTVTSIKNNNIPMHWIEYNGDGNPYKNFKTALMLYKQENKLPAYIIKIDNDIHAKTGMLDKMHGILKESPDDIGYAYCTFNFSGYINITFKALEFSEKRLKIFNYISSISLMKTEILEKVGIITDDKYFRLLDWALWLNFLNNGYKGIPVPDTSFTAYTVKNNVSCGDSNEYIKKAKNVRMDFINNY